MTIYLVQSRRAGGDWAAEVYRDTAPAAEQWVRDRQNMLPACQLRVIEFAGAYVETPRHEQPRRVAMR